MNAQTHQNNSRVLSGVAWLVLGGLFFDSAGVTAGFAAPEYMATAVSARADKSYVRARDNDGNYKPEYFAFGEGGRWNGPFQDLSIDRLSFVEVGHAVAPALRLQNYLPATDSKKARLLIMLYWGTTQGAGDRSSSIAAQNFTAANAHLADATAEKNAVKSTQGLSQNMPPGPMHGAKNWGTWVNSFSPTTFETVHQSALTELLQEQAAENELNEALTINAISNRERDRQNWKNATMLGYEEEVSAFVNQHFTAMQSLHRDAVDEIEENRYFVVLMAYDFQRLLKTGQHVLLWETRLSIRQRGNDFDKSLSAMAGYAGHFFGEDSHGLVRERKLRERIRLDELKIIGEVPDAH